MPYISPAVRICTRARGWGLGGEGGGRSTCGGGILALHLKAHALRQLVLGQEGQRDFGLCVKAQAVGLEVY
jgi:hypothetical protein